MNSINTYIHPNQLFEAEISSFGEPTLHDLRTDVESALRTRDEFINAYFPSSAAHYLRLTAMTALGLPLCAAIGMGGMCSGGIALSHALSAFLLEDANPSVVFMSSRWADGIVSTLGAALAGGLIYVGINSAVDILSANDISNSNENRKHLEKLNVNLSNAHQALANAIGRLPERALIDALQETQIPSHYLLEAVGKDQQKLFLVMEHLLDERQRLRSDLQADDRLFESISLVADSFVKELDDSGALLERLSGSPAPEHILSMMALSSLAPITDMPLSLREYLETHPQILHKTATTMMSLADLLKVPNFLKQLQDGRSSGIPQTIYDMNRRLNCH